MQINNPTEFSSSQRKAFFLRTKLWIGSRRTGVAQATLCGLPASVSLCAPSPLFLLSTLPFSASALSAQAEGMVCHIENRNSCLLSIQNSCGNESTCLRCPTLVQSTRPWGWPHWTIWPLGPRQSHGGLGRAFKSDHSPSQYLSLFLDKREGKIGRTM